MVFSNFHLKTFEKGRETRILHFVQNDRWEGLRGTRTSLRTLNPEL